MSKADALEKRIKRNITAREHRFFVVVPPGLGNVCQDELSMILGPDRPLAQVDGGIEFSGTVLDAYKVNLQSRTASRIIMRFADFTATDFQTLEKKLKNIPWELYLTKSHRPVIHVTARKSRLYHTGAIDQRFRENIAWRLENSDTFGGLDQGEMTDQNIFVRVLNDRFELSLDSSGSLLYMRGLKTQGGKAPMRENLAAGILAILGYDGRMPLIDPMCGAGSFSLEAAMISNHIPPGWYRSFAFQHWPCFREGAFRHIRKAAEELIKTPSQARIFASDTDEKALKALEQTVQERGFSETIAMKKENVFHLSPPSREKGLIVVNPPYGIRLGSEKESRELIESLFKTLGKNFKGWRLGVVSPFDKTGIDVPRHVRRHSFVHGGLTLFLLSCTIG